MSARTQSWCYPTRLLLYFVHFLYGMGFLTVLFCTVSASFRLLFVRHGLTVLLDTVSAAFCILLACMGFLSVGLLLGALPHGFSCMLSMGSTRDRQPRASAWLSPPARRVATASASGQPVPRTWPHRSGRRLPPGGGRLCGPSGNLGYAYFWQGLCDLRVHRPRRCIVMLNFYLYMASTVLEISVSTS